MSSNDQRQGRWTRLFGRPTLFSEDARRAKEVPSSIQLFGVENMPEFQYVKIIFEGIEGWERPLWASDGEWLYLRRPQGVWKTRLPKEYLDRIGVIGQAREGSKKTYGGIQIGHDFSNCPAWHVNMQEIEPEDMDEFYGPLEDGYEEGPLISEWIEDVAQRVVVDAGDVFYEPPLSCQFFDGEIRAEGVDGRKVRFVIDSSFDIEPIARQGNLWLRFGHGVTSWMDPFDCKVTFSV